MSLLYVRPRRSVARRPVWLVVLSRTRKILYAPSLARCATRRSAGWPSGRTIVAVALPAIERDLGATAAQLEWIVSGYVFSFAVLLITGGRVGDIYGRKRMFLIGVTGFTLASVSCAVATSGDLLVVSRLVQGAFGAMMIPQVLSIIQVYVRAQGARRSVRGNRGQIRSGSRCRTTDRCHPRLP